MHDKKDLPNNLSTPLSKILIAYIKNNSKNCRNNYKLANTQQFCPFEVKWEDKCHWCVFKRMTPLTEKMPVFRFSGSDNDDKDQKNFWRLYFSVNFKVTARVIDYFKLELVAYDHGHGLQSMYEGVEIKKRTDRRFGKSVKLIEKQSSSDTHMGSSLTSSSTASKRKIEDHPDNSVTVSPEVQAIQKVIKLNDSCQNALYKIYNILKQIHTDQMTKKPYLDGIFENPTYLFKRLGVSPNRNIDSIELISIETYRDPLTKGIQFHNPLVAQPQRPHQHGSTSSPNATSAKNIINQMDNFSPLKITSHLHSFMLAIIRLFSNTSSIGDGRGQIATCAIQMISIAVRNLEAARNAKSNLNSYDRQKVSEALQKNLYDTTNFIEKIDKAMVTLQFLWSFDHITGKFYLNHQAHFSFETLKTKIFLKLEESAAAKFISDLYITAKTLSARPKFQLLLMVMLHADEIMNHRLKFLYDRQRAEENYFTLKDRNFLETQFQTNSLIMDAFRNLVPHFDLTDTMLTLKYLIPQAVEMELFMLSEVSKKEITEKTSYSFLQKCWVSKGNTGPHGAVGCSKFLKTPWYHIWLLSYLLKKWFLGRLPKDSGHSIEKKRPHFNFWLPRDFPR